MARLVDICTQGLASYTMRLNPERSGIANFYFGIGSSSDFDPTVLSSYMGGPQAEMHDLAILSNTLRSGISLIKQQLTLPEGRTGFSQDSIFPGVSLVTLTFRSKGQRMTRVFLAGKGRITGVTQQRS